MDQTFYIVGPTGVGKSRLAAEVAARCGAEIIGADAFQVYAGFDLLTAKPDAATLRRAPHHLIGVVPPTEEYNVARYLEAATAVRREISRRGRRALIVGGTGLYVKALTHGLSELPRAQPELRAELEALDLAVLVARLEALDPPAAATIDRLNRRRVVRALEVCLATGGRFSEHRAEWNQTVSARGVLLTRERDDLRRSIDRRVEDMFAAGVMEEMKREESAKLGATAARMIGLATIRETLAGRVSEADCLEQIKVQTRQYAKRQMTWFRREQFLVPINLSVTSFEDAVDRIVAEVERLTDQGRVGALVSC